MIPYLNWNWDFVLSCLLVSRGSLALHTTIVPTKSYPTVGYTGHTIPLDSVKSQSLALHTFVFTSLSIFTLLHIRQEVLQKVFHFLLAILVSTLSTERRPLQWILWKKMFHCSCQFKHYNNQETFSWNSMGNTSFIII